MIGLSKSVYKVKQINKKLFKLHPKDNTNPYYAAEPELEDFRKSYSRNIEATNRVILRRRNTQHLIQPFSKDNNVKPKLKQLMRKHRQEEKDYKTKQMQKYFKRHEMEVWDELTGKLMNLRKRSENLKTVPNPR